MDGLCEVSTSIWVLLLSEQRFRSGENSVGQWVQHLVQHCSILSRTLTSCSTSSRLTPWFKLTFQQLLRPDGGHVWCCVHVALRMIYRISLVTWYQICIPFVSSCKQSWFFFSLQFHTAVKTSLLFSCWHSWHISVTWMSTASEHLTP